MQKMLNHLLSLPVVIEGSGKRLSVSRIIGTFRINNNGRADKIGYIVNLRDEYKVIRHVRVIHCQQYFVLHKDDSAKRRFDADSFRMESGARAVISRKDNWQK